jgi:hypothetical protein
MSSSLIDENRLAKGSRLAAKTTSGSVDLQLPADVAAEFEVSTFSGEIVNDFGPAVRRDCFARCAVSQ